MVRGIAASGKYRGNAAVVPLVDPHGGDPMPAPAPASWQCARRPLDAALRAQLPTPGSGRARGCQAV